MSPDPATDKPATLPTPGVFSVLGARDADATIAFLVEVLGFTRTAYYADGGTVHHAELRGPCGGGVMVNTRTDGDGAPAYGSYVVSPDVDAAYDRARAAGARITREIQEMDYDSREFSVADPDGTVWSVGSYPGEGYAATAG